eukprot:12185624-Heterocapsa_arctica.AAC.1
MEGLESRLLQGQGRHGPGAAGTGAAAAEWCADGLGIPVPDDEYAIALADVFASDYVGEDRLTTAIVEPTPVPASDSAMPPVL